MTPKQTILARVREERLRVAVQDGRCARWYGVQRPPLTSDEAMREAWMAGWRAMDKELRR